MERKFNVKILRTLRKYLISVRIFVPNGHGEMNFGFFPAKHEDGEKENLPVNFSKLFLCTQYVDHYSCLFVGMHAIGLVWAISP